MVDQGRTTQGCRQHADAADEGRNGVVGLVATRLVDHAKAMGRDDGVADSHSRDDKPQQKSANANIYLKPHPERQRTDAIASIRRTLCEDGRHTHLPHRMQNRTTAAPGKNPPDRVRHLNECILQSLRGIRAAQCYMRCEFHLMTN